MTSLPTDTIPGPGWVCVASGDGLSAYQATSSDPIAITTPGSGVNGVDNQNSWFVINSPDSERFLLVQRLASSSQWKVTYSKSTFDYTSSGASTPPALEKNLNNGNDNGSVVFNGTLFPHIENTYYYNVCAGDVSNTSFYFFTYPIGKVSSGATAMIIMDVLSSDAQSTSDNDPCVVYANVNSNPVHATDGVLFENRIHKTADQTGTNCFKGFVCYDATSPPQSFLKMTVSTYGSSSSASRAAANYGPYNMTTNSYDTNSYESLPVYYFYLSSATASNAYDSFKGGSSLMLYGNRNLKTGDILSSPSATTAGAQDYKLFINGFLFPWDGTALSS